MDSRILGLHVPNSVGLLSNRRHLAAVSCREKRTRAYGATQIDCRQVSPLALLIFYALLTTFTGDRDHASVARLAKLTAPSSMEYTVMPDMCSFLERIAPVLPACKIRISA
jgi:hypothetical protein